MPIQLSPHAQRLMDYIHNNVWVSEAHARNRGYILEIDELIAAGLVERIQDGEVTIISLKSRTA